METDFGDSDGPSLHLSAPSFEGAGGGGGGGVVMRTVKRPRPVKSCLECRYALASLELHLQLSSLHGRTR